MKVPLIYEGKHELAPKSSINLSFPKSKKANAFIPSVELHDRHIICQFVETNNEYKVLLFNAGEYPFTVEGIIGYVNVRSSRKKKK